LSILNLVNIFLGSVINGFIIDLRVIAYVCLYQKVESFPFCITITSLLPVVEFISLSKELSLP